MSGQSVIREKKEVEAFLRQFFPKMDIWGIFFLNRDKNYEALRLLGITPVAREEIIREIVPEDYVETVIDMASYGDMWVFGKDHEGRELYIKVSMGQPGSKTICISFHTAERPIRYAFKDKEE